MGRRALACLTTGAAVLAPSIARACDSIELIESSERIGWILLAVSMAIAAASMTIVRRSKQTWASIWLGALLASHPGWWMSARGGDCGRTRLFTSWGATGAMIALGLVLLYRSRRKLDG